MTPTTYQTPEIRDSNDNIIKQGSFGKNTALANSTNDGWIDYVANDLEFLYGLAKDEVVPVSALPASGDMNKTYLLTTTGVCYRWDGTEWVEISSSEAVGRAEAAADLAEEWATKTSGAVADNEYSAKHYSNVSKDWANKLNATVDGSEYSAKHYAGVAEGWAEDAEDTAEDIADHLAQIEENTTDIGIADKRISNIEKLLQGNLYDYQTDSTSAYTKSVPAGAMPYAGLEKIGGKTVVWNQYIKNGNFADSSNWIAANGTLSVSDNTATVSAGTSGSQTLLIQSISTQTIVGHKYIFSADLSTTQQTRAWLSLGGNQAETDSVYAGYVDPGSFKHVVGIIAPTTTISGIYIMFVRYNDVDYYVKNVKFIDLTLLYGAGREPSTVEEFESMFSAEWYSYSAPTLLSAGVTEVESVGKNLFDALNSYYEGGAIIYNTPVGTVISKTTPPSSVTEVGEGVYKFPAGNWAGAIWVIPVKKDETVVISGNVKSNGVQYLRGSVYELDFNSTILKSTPFITSNVSETNLNYSYTPSTNGVVYLAVGICETGSTACEVTLTNFQVEHGSTKTAYSPYMSNDYPIPASIQALEGYGWSVGSVYNYVDFEAKKFVQNVARVDLGSLTWMYYASGQTMYTDSLTSTLHAEFGVVANIITDRYIAVNNSDLPSYDKAMGAAITGRLSIRDTAYSDADVFKTAMNGVYLYYELTTPVETDISAYLTDDNLINVESGGTLTFPNQNGTDYRLPVPSEEEYMIDLQEAINNG